MICGVGNARSNVIVGKFGIVAKDFLEGHSCGQPADHIVNGNPHPANRWSPTALAGFDCDDLFVGHVESRLLTVRRLPAFVIFIGFED